MAEGVELNRILSTNRGTRRTVQRYVYTTDCRASEETALDVLGGAEAASAVLGAVSEQVRKRGWARRAVRKAVRAVDVSVPTRPLTAWTKRESTIRDVWGRPGPPDDRAVARADSYLAGASRVWGRKDERVRRSLLEAVLADMHRAILGELEPSTAVQLASERSAAEHAKTHDLLAADADRSAASHAATQSLIRDLGDSTHAHARLQLVERIRQLPASIREAAERRADDDFDGVWQVVRPITALEADPVELAGQWQHAQPPWFPELAAPAVLVAADVAWCYDARALAEELYLRAARYGEPRVAHWAARSALLAFDGGDSERARAILAEFESEQSEGFFRCVDAVVAQDSKRLRVALADWRPTDPMERSLRYGLLVRDTTQGRKGRDAVRDGLDEAVLAGRAELRLPHSSNGTRLLLAQVLVARARTDVSGSRLMDLREAKELSLEARDWLRLAKASSAIAVLIACEVCLFASDFRAILSIAEAEADGQEYNDPRVRAFALLARAELGEDVSSQLDSSGPPPFFAALTRAAIARRSGADPVPQLRVALESARGQSERIAAIENLARAGVQDLPELDQLADEQPRFATELRALQQLTGAGAEAGVARLRAQAARSPAAAASLAQYLRGEGRTEELISVLLSAAETFEDPVPRLEAAIALAGLGQRRDARVEAERVVASTSADWPGTRTARLLSAELAAEQSDLVAASAHLRQALLLDPADTHTRWGLVRLLAHRSELVDAWAVLRETGTVPDPITEWDAVAWLHLHEEFAPPADLIRGCLRLIRQFPESERVRAAALQLVLVMDTGDLDLSPELIEQFQQELAEFTEQWPESQWLRSVDAPDDPEALRAMVTEWVRPSDEQQQGRRDLSTKVSLGEYPVGLLALAARRSYSEIIVLRGEDVLPARSFDPNETAAAVQSARDALGKRVAIDVTALSVLGLLDPEVRAQAVGRYSTVTIDEALADARMARAAFAKGGAHASWNENTKSVSFHETDPTQLAENRQRADQLLDALASTARVPAPPLVEGAERLQQATWWRLLDYARVNHVPVWIDDAVMRQVARSDGIEAFSTRAVLAVLGEMGTTSVPSIGVFDRLMLEERIGDLPLSEMSAAVMDVAEADKWLPGRIAYALRRPAQWIDPASGLSVFAALLPQVRVHAPASLPTWTYVSVYGAALAHRAAPEAASAVVSGILATVVHVTGAQGASAARLVAAARSALNDVGFVAPEGADPVVNAIRMLYHGLSETLPMHLAAQYILGLASALDDDSDRQSIVRLLLTDIPPDELHGALGGIPNP